MAYTGSQPTCLLAATVRRCTPSRTTSVEAFTLKALFSTAMQSFLRELELAHVKNTKAARACHCFAQQRRDELAHIVGTDL